MSSDGRVMVSPLWVVEGVYGGGRQIDADGVGFPVSAGSNAMSGARHQVVTEA